LEVTLNIFPKPPVASSTARARKLWISLVASSRATMPLTGPPPSSGMARSSMANSS